MPNPTLPSYFMQLISVWNLIAREALNSANKDWFQLLNRDVPEAYWLPLDPPNSAMPLRTYQHLASNTWKKKFQSLPPDIHSCSHKCPQARATFLPANYKKMFTPKIKEWREINNTDGSVIKHKDDDSPPLSGSGAYKPGRDASPPSQHLQLHIKPYGPINIINRAELGDILVALQQGQTDIASDSASCLFQISKQPLI
eukprot:1161359-Pelagomonas_calceolata.AAC.3